MQERQHARIGVGNKEVYKSKECERQRVQKSKYIKMKKVKHRRTQRM
jgi:hypothetical protein